MKLILSRKGFDSSAGRMPSPILPDGTLLSLPIPTDADPEFTYGDLQYGQSSYQKIISQLKRTFKDGYCHLDPDLRPEAVARPAGWRPAFGQSGAALSHLNKYGVGAGDLFLFFGWFRQTEFDPSGKLRYVKGAPDQHIIFGYLQVGEIIEPHKDPIPAWLGTHPHSAERRKDNPRNRIYVAAERLSLGGDLPGAGTLSCRADRVLTRPGKKRRYWNLPEIFRHTEISYHKPEAWQADGSFMSVARGQEFVVEASGDIRDWILKIVSEP
ncbi:hypothetical protein [Alistipes indistinctus]|uniref:Nmad3 family putative nucleotide modification protein n=1 Tax=Alistipes indistinctus TaxID=626932 RepID=UPI003AB8460A